jgi:hypothetical protein
LELPILVEAVPAVGLQLGTRGVEQRDAPLYFAIGHSFFLELGRIRLANLRGRHGQIGGVLRRGEYPEIGLEIVFRFLGKCQGGEEDGRDQQATRADAQSAPRTAG